MATQNPISAVHAPSGVSKGLNSSRAAMSAPTLTPAPMIAVTASRNTSPAPGTNHRVTVGATKATHAMGPQAATTSATSNAATPRASSRQRPGLIPRAEACSSPRDSTPSAGSTATVAAQPMTRGTISGRAASAVISVSEPTRYLKMMLNSTWSAVDITVSTAACQAVDTAAPMSRVCAALRPLAAASRHRAPPATAPARAPAVRAVSEWMPLVTSSAATKAAPPLTPSRSGTASGLRMARCTSSPATPSPAPAAAPTSSRGRRISRNTIRATRPDAGRPR